MKKIIVLFILGLLVISCGPVKKETKIGTVKPEAIDSTFGPADEIKVVEYMVNSIKQARFVRSMKYRRSKPHWMLAKELDNQTSNHINTRKILEKIRTRLIKEGMAKFVDKEALNDVLKQQQLQHSDLYDNAKTAKVGKLVGAKIILRGRISSIESNDERTSRVFYTITMQAVGLETSKILWTDELEIGRMSKKRRYR